MDFPISQYFIYIDFQYITKYTWIEFAEISPKKDEKKFLSQTWVKITYINDSFTFPICVEWDYGYISLTKAGLMYKESVNGECMLFPSKDQRDWSKFKATWLNKPKFDPKTLKPFDRVLARIDGGDAYCWFADLVSTPMIEKYDILPCIMSNKDVEMIIPYNEDTKHLVGTAEEPSEFYRYWDD